MAENGHIRFRGHFPGKIQTNHFINSLQKSRKLELRNFESMVLKSHYSKRIIQFYLSFIFNNY